MLWLVLDASVANVLYSYRLKGFPEAKLSHRRLQTTLALQLLRDPASVLRQRESNVMILGQKSSKIEKLVHQWIKPGKRGICVQCKPPTKGKGGRPRKGQQGRKTQVQETDERSEVFDAQRGMNDVVQYNIWCEI